jgi:WD40 repeat protein
MAVCADFSLDGRILAVACQDTTDRKIHLYNAATYEEIPSFPPFDGAPRFLAFSPDGRTLAVHCYNDKVFICDLATRRAIYSIPSRCMDCASLAFSADGRLLAATAPNGRVLLWDMRTRRRVRLVAAGYNTGVIALSPRGRVLATDGPDNALSLYDLTSGTKRVLRCGSLVTSLAFSRDGERLAAGLQDGALRLFDVVSGRRLPAPRGDPHWVYSIAFSPDDRRLATASSDSSVLLWDLATGREIAHLRGHRSEVMAVRFSPDGRTLASASIDGTVKLWDAASSTRGHDIPGDNFALSPDGRRLAVQRAGEPGVALVNPVTGRTEGRFQTGSGASAPIRFSPRGDLLYVATTMRREGGTAVVADDITIWSVADQRQVARIPAAGASYQWTSVSPDGRYLALNTQMIDLSGRRRLPALKGDSATFSPDGRMLVTCDSDTGLLRLYEPGTLRLMSSLHGDKAGAAAFSSDGHWLAVAVGVMGYVQIWDTRSWKPVRSFKATSGSFPGGLAFSSDGQTLATFPGDAECQLWDTRTWRPTLTLKHPGGVFPQLQFTSDGTAVATWGPAWGGGLFHLWPAPSPAEADAGR